MIHDVIVFEDAFPPGVVALFDAFLSGFDGAVEPGVLEFFAFLHAEAFHDLGHAFGGPEVAHEVVFEAEEEFAGAGVALAGGATAQLAIDAAGFVAFGAEDKEAAEVGDAFAKFDVGAPTGHVGGDGEGAFLTGAGDDFGFLAVVFGVEDGVGDFLEFEHAAQGLRGVDAGGADEDGLTFGVELFDEFDDGVVFFTTGFVDAVVGVNAADGLVGGDGEDVEVVDVVELGGVGFGGAGHAAQVLVEAEVVLDGDGGQRLGFGVDLNAFFGFDCLVESVRPATAWHFATGLFVDDDDFVFFDDILDVFFVDAVGAEELGDLMDALALVVEFGLEGFFFLGALFVGDGGVTVDFGVEGGEVGEDEAVWIIRVEEVAAHFGEIGVVAFLVDGVVEFFFEFEELDLLSVLVDGEFGFFAGAAEFGVLHGTEQATVFGLPEMDLVEFAAGEFEVARFGGFVGFGDEAAGEGVLATNELFDEGFVAFELVGAGGGGDGAADDEGGASLVDEDGVHFVDDGEVMAALDLLFATGGHAVVAKVVEAEFGVGSEGDIALVLGAAEVRGLVVLDATDGETEVFEEVAHPFGVTACEVVVDGNDVDAAAGEGVQGDGQGADEGFAFAGGHFSDHAAMEGDAADELDVEVDHVPGEGHVTDVVDLATHAAGGILDDGVAFGEDVLEHFAHDGVEFGLDFIPSIAGFVDGGFFLVEGLACDLEGGGVECGEVGFQAIESVCESGEAFVDGGFVCDAEGDTAEESRGVEGTELFLPSGHARAKGVFGLVLELGFNAVDLGNDRLEALDGALVFGADDFFDDPVEHEKRGQSDRGPGEELRADLDECSIWLNKR